MDTKAKLIALGAAAELIRAIDAPEQIAKYLIQ